MIDLRLREASVHAEDLAVHPAAAGSGEERHDIRKWLRSSALVSPLAEEEFGGHWSGGDGVNAVHWPTHEPGIPEAMARQALRNGAADSARRSGYDGCFWHRDGAARRLPKNEM
jgi:hypothetical protein